MKCIKCGEKNICKANYCKKCGYHFSEQEQKAAKGKTLVGKIEKLEKLKKIKSIVTLKIITENKYFKIAVLLLIIATGIFFHVHYGNELRILESNHYQVQYNTELKEYYLLTDKDETTLELYKPNYVTDIMIIHYDQNHSKIEEIPYSEKSAVVLKTNENEDYYIVKSNEKKKSEKNIKIYIFRKDNENE